MPRAAQTLGWFCSFSSVLLAVVCTTLALHGFLVGDSPAIVEHSGPFGLTMHYSIVGAAALIATWGAPPIWVVTVAFRFSWESGQIYLMQLLIFALGWCLSFAAFKLIEISPAGRLF